MLKKTAWLWISTLPLIARDGGAASVVLVPSRDNTLIQWSAETAGANPLLSNGQGDIFVGRTNQDGQEEATISKRRGLVRFDVAAAIPAGMRITNVTLTMRDVRSRNGDPTIMLHRVLNDWGEGASFFNGGQGIAARDDDATWLHTFYDEENPGASPTWDEPGGDFVPLASGEAVVADDGGEGQLISWSSLGMVADVQSWFNEPAENFGWIMIGDETRGQSAKRFNSRESTDAPNIPPILAVEYAPVLAGDYNDDGTANAADYAFWRDRLGATLSLVNETATLGTVTNEDYIVWKANFGAALPSSSSLAPVPEPISATLALVGMVIIATAWRAPR